MKRKFKATMPGSETKTHRDYFWLLPDDMDDIVTCIKDLQSTGFSNFKALNLALSTYYNTQILKESGVAIKDEDGNAYTMRTIRAAKATEWILLKKEYEVMKWEPHPPNPLQHTNEKMTIAKYATKGSDHSFNAKLRCVKKYGDNQDLR